MDLKEIESVKRYCEVPELVWSFEFYVLVVWSVLKLRMNSGPR